MKRNAHEHHSATHTLPAPAHYHHHHLKVPILLILLVLTLSTILLVSLLLCIIISLRRLKSKNNSGDCSHRNNGSIDDAKFKFNPLHATISISPSPEVGRGCIHSRRLGLLRNYAKFQGVQVLTYKELEEATNNFSENNVIGKGGYGVVYKGILWDGTVAAIKLLSTEGKEGDHAFRTEVDLLSRLHSPYIVKLLGYCADQHHRLLVFEFMPNSSLQYQLHSTGDSHRPLDWATRLAIALDCARALEFLHEQLIPSIIHRNFKCSNILLDQYFRAKISDLGLAKTGSDKINGQILTRVLGTTGYLAPEYASTGKLTTKSDVYSYGVVLLQLLSGRVPIDIKRPAGEHVLAAWALPKLMNREAVLEIVDPTLRGQFSKKDLIQVAAIAALCVQPEADYRPLMTDIVQSLIPLMKNHPPNSSSTSSRFLNQISSPRS